jgi:hypothetical protein
MKIGIIGAGFYGCFFALKLSKGNNVTIYEKSNKLLCNAATNNQNRLHLGYHYPRSKSTIAQVVDAYNDFKNEFSDCVRFVKKNVYAIHKDSNIDFDEYCKIYDYYNLDHSIMNKNDKTWNLFKSKKNISGCLLTKEGIIDSEMVSRKLSSQILSNKNIAVLCNYTVNDKNIEKIKKENDIVINCTYNQPFIGFVNKKIETKHENCLIAIMKDPKYSNVGLTIMDGPFCSLYPSTRNRFTLSSVIYTPFQKENLFNYFDLKKQLYKIINHGNDYFRFSENLKLEGYYIGKKTKIKKDINDQRESIVTREGNMISVFSGKVSAAMSVYKKVKDEINK